MLQRRAQHMCVANDEHLSLAIPFIPAPVACRCHIHFGRAVGGPLTLLLHVNLQQGHVDLRHRPALYSGLTRHRACHEQMTL